MSEDKKTKTSDTGPSPVLRYVVGFVICVIILGSSSVAAIYFLFNQEEVEKRTPPPKIPLVEAVTLQLTTHTIHLPSQGRVQARAVTSINPEVSGRIISIEPSFKEGGFFKPGQKLLTLDNSDYLNAIAKTKGTIAQLKAKLALEKIERSSLTNAVVIAESNLKQAEASLILKIAEQDAAIANLKRINKLEGASSLAKKEPQVAEAQANVGAKQASLTKAKRDLLDKPKQMEAELLGQIQVAESEANQAQRNLERTTVYAPRYQGRITEKRVDVGQVVNANTILATAIAIDYAEVRLPVSNQSLAHMNVPEQLVRTNQTQSAIPSEPTEFPAVTLTATIGARKEKWLGHIDRAESRYDSISQQLFLIAQVPEPYGRNPALRAGLFVRADIIGNTMLNVFVLDRHTVRRGNEVVLAVKKKGPLTPKGGTHLLKRKEIKILWRDEKVIITKSLEPGDILITTSIEYAADGDELRVGVDGKPPPSPKGKGKRKPRARKRPTGRAPQE